MWGTFTYIEVGQYQNINIVIHCLSYMYTNDLIHTFCKNDLWNQPFSFIVWYYLLCKILLLSDTDQFLLRGLSHNTALTLSKYLNG